MCTQNQRKREKERKKDLDMESSLEVIPIYSKILFYSFEKILLSDRSRMVLRLHRSDDLKSKFSLISL